MNECENGENKKNEQEKFVNKLIKYGQMKKNESLVIFRFLVIQKFNKNDKVYLILVPV